MTLPAFLCATLSYLAVNSYAIYLLHNIPGFVAEQYGVYLIRPGWAGELVPITLALAFSLTMAAIARAISSRASRRAR